MITFNIILNQNTLLAYWFNNLNETEKATLIPIFDQVLITTGYYNSLFYGFEVYVTGSSLNLIERSYNDIDLMVVIPSETIKKSKLELLKDLRDHYKNRDILALEEMVKEPMVTIFGLTGLLKSLKDSLVYLSEIFNSNKDALLKRLDSTMQVKRILMDPEAEITAIKVRMEGLLETEKPISPFEADGTHGYQLGTFVEVFLKNVIDGLSLKNTNDTPKFFFQQYKSFSEGYSKTAGENNICIYSKPKSTPIHLFLTTGVDYKRAMEKKESFMLEYYSEQERLRPIKLF